jgi:uncharacterized membrane protein
MPEERAASTGSGTQDAPRSPSTKKVVLVYSLTAAGTLAWLAGIFLAPYLRSQDIRWAGLVYAVYSPVCHQLASRSLCAWGYPLGVCARCLGIYLGFAAGVASYPFIRGFRRIALPATGAFLLVSAPIVADAAANFLRIWATSGGIRLATGLLWGTLLPYYFIPGFAELRLRRPE